MEKPDRTSTLAMLNTQWGNYVHNFQKMPPDERAEFLEKQGYARFADLLAHLTAWWKMGMQTIETYKVDRAYEHPSVDVDYFNANAVAAARDRSEVDIIQEFESTRMAFVDYVTLQLSDHDLENPKIQWQLNIELFGHYEEHKI